jgi:hypothetical protein
VSDFSDPARPLGRDTQATIGAWPSIKAGIPALPRLAFGEPAPRSPELWRYRNPRKREQLIGCCVGEATASMLETTIRTPNSTTDTKPRLPINLSALWCYGAARNYSRSKGIEFGRGEGAIVSHAVLALQSRGALEWANWPSSEANYKAAAGAGIEREFARKSGQFNTLRPVQKAAILTSWDSILSTLAAGYSVAIGVPWPKSALTTQSTGRFDWRPSLGVVGGHAVELLGYDLGQARVWIGNSWPNWGSHQMPNVGFTPLRNFAETFSPQAMRSGEAEAVVVAEVDGPWSAKRIDWSKVWG